jgi:hypothetical protein
MLPCAATTSPFHPFSVTSGIPSGEAQLRGGQPLASASGVAGSSFLPLITEGVPMRSLLMISPLWAEIGMGAAVAR